MANDSGSLMWGSSNVLEQEYYSPEGLTPTDRKILHTLAENAGISSTSKGEGRHRLVIIRKVPRENRFNDFKMKT